MREDVKKGGKRGEGGMMARRGIVEWKKKKDIRNLEKEKENERERGGERGIKGNRYRNRRG